MYDTYCEIILIAKSFTTDEIGQEIAVETQKSVLGEITSVSQNEYYNAVLANLKPSLRAIIWDFEYSNEDILIIDNIRYSVIRTFKRNDGKIELYLEKRVGNG